MTPRDYWLGWTLFGLATAVVLLYVTVVITSRLDTIIALLEKQK